MLASGSFEVGRRRPAAAGRRRARRRRGRAGRLSVGGEHAASAADRHGASRRRSRRPGHAGKVSVLVGLPPGSRHELGALAFAVALRRRGVGVMYLGPDVTVDAWVDVDRPDEGSGRRRRRRHRRRPGAPAAAVVERCSSTVRVAIVAVGGAAASGRRVDSERASCGCPTASSTPPRPSPRRSAADADVGRASAVTGRGAGRRRLLAPSPADLPARRRGPTGAGARAAESRVDGTRSNGRGRRSRNSRPLDRSRRPGASPARRSCRCPGAVDRSSGRMTRWKPGSASASPGVSAQPGCIAANATDPATPPRPLAHQRDLGPLRPRIGARTRVRRRRATRGRRGRAAGRTSRPTSPRSPATRWSVAGAAARPCHQRERADDQQRERRLDAVGALATRPA